MSCGGGAGSEGGALAAVGGRAAEHGHLFRAGAGAGEGAAQQGGTVTIEASRFLHLMHQINLLKYRRLKYQVSVTTAENLFRQVLKFDFLAKNLLSE